MPKTKHLCTCLHCGKQTVGNKGKKYCDDDCRAAYNNSLRENKKTDAAKLKISYKGNIIEIEINNTLITYNQANDTTSVTNKKVKKS